MTASASSLTSPPMAASAAVAAPASAPPAEAIAPLRDFVRAATDLIARPMDEAVRIAALRPLLAELLRTDDWLPEAATCAHPDHYCQYLLHCDPLERFSVVSFVWGPGQRTPIHDHTVWGLIGMLRGAETGQNYRLEGDRLQADGAPLRLERGDIEQVSPAIGDIHQVFNAHDDRVSISIHVYGANIGATARHVYDAQTGRVTPFVSGYTGSAVPNLWDRSAAVRRGFAKAAA